MYCCVSPLTETTISPLPGKWHHASQSMCAWNMSSCIMLSIWRTSVARSSRISCALSSRSHLTESMMCTSRVPPVSTFWWLMRWVSLRFVCVISQLVVKLSVTNWYRYLTFDMRTLCPDNCVNVQDLVASQPNFSHNIFHYVFSTDLTSSGLTPTVSRNDYPFLQIKCLQL